MSIFSSTTGITLWLEGKHSCAPAIPCTAAQYTIQVSSVVPLLLSKIQNLLNDHVYIDMSIYALTFVGEF